MLSAPSRQLSGLQGTLELHIAANGYTALQAIPEGASSLLANRALWAERAGLADQASSAEVATWAERAAEAERAAWADTVDGYHYSDLAGIFVNESHDKMGDKQDSIAILEIVNTGDGEALVAKTSSTSAAVDVRTGASKGSSCQGKGGFA